MVLDGTATSPKLMYFIYIFTCSLNFFRLVRLVLDHIPSVLRDFADDKCQLNLGCSFQEACQNRGLCSTMQCNFPKQQTVLSRGNPQEWDPSLLCFVLLQLPSVRKWNLTTDEVKGIKKLRDARNDFFGHQPNASHPKSKLHAAVAEVEAAYNLMKIPTPKIDAMKMIEKGLLLKCMLLPSENTY